MYTVNVMVSPRCASLLSASTVKVQVEAGAANAGTAVANILNIITKQSKIEVIRLFMTKLLSIICGAFFHTHRFAASLSYYTMGMFPSNIFLTPSQHITYVV